MLYERMNERKGVPVIDTNNISPLTRQEGENDFQYHKRLVFGKLKDKTLADYDYSEIAPYVYGKDYSCDVSRRMMYGSCKTLELMEENSISYISDKNIVSDIEAKKVELQKERQKFFDQRREYNKLINSEGREDHLRDVLEKSAIEVAKNSNHGDDYYSTFSYTDSENEAVLVFNDWHYGMTTNNIFNKFNTEICRQRVANVVAMAKQRIRLHECDKLHVIILGDLLHGACHTSCRVASEELTCDQLMQVAEVLARAIIELRGCAEHILVYSTYGNHARTVQKKEDSIHRDNWERIIPWWLESRISAEELVSGEQLNITIMPESENEFIFVDACGHGICASHGDLDSVKTSPRLLSTLFQKAYGQNIECVLLGDKHHRESFEELGVCSMVCGSLCGTDEYANNKRLYSEPSQLLLIINKETGVDAEYRLRL